MKTPMAGDLCVAESLCREITQSTKLIKLSLEIEAIDCLYRTGDATNGDLPCNCGLEWIGLPDIQQR
jgi:hypothetical protein